MFETLKKKLADTIHEAEQDSNGKNDSVKGSLAPIESSPSAKTDEALLSQNGNRE